MMFQGSPVQAPVLQCPSIPWPVTVIKRWLSSPPGVISCRGVCVEPHTLPLHNDDGSRLPPPVLLLSASPAELQLLRRRPGPPQRGAPPLWHGEDDQVQDLPGLPAQLPPHLQLHPLPGAPGQPRRAHLKGMRPLTAIFTRRGQSIDPSAKSHPLHCRLTNRSVSASRTLVVSDVLRVQAGLVDLETGYLERFLKESGRLQERLTAHTLFLFWIDCRISSSKSAISVTIHYFDFFICLQTLVLMNTVSSPTTRNPNEFKKTQFFKKREKCKQLTLNHYSNRKRLCLIGSLIWCREEK